MANHPELFSAEKPSLKNAWFCPKCQTTIEHEDLTTRRKKLRYKCKVCGTHFEAPLSIRMRQAHHRGGLITNRRKLTKEN